MNTLKKYLFSPFKNDWKLLLTLSTPALLLCLFGLNQLGRLTAVNFLAAESVKLVCEFLFLGAALSLLNLLGVKNKWLTALLAFIYYLTLTADLVLLWYFKERFGAKYLDTMEGGDYAFLTDWRVLSYFAVLALFSFFAVKRYFAPATRKTALHRGAICLAGLLLLYVCNPLALLPAPNNFYTSYLIPPSPVYTLNAVLARRPTANLDAALSPELEQLAQQHNVFSAKNTGVGKKYTRVILIASESLSNKYLHRFNPNIPPQASRPLDELMEQYPSASLQHVTLSTLYGLTVIFTSHPYAELSFENGYPVSLVKELKKNGFHTAFLRGADETYMDEHLLFKQAGFDEVIGATLDYLGQEYEEIDEEFYDVPTLPRAFARFGQDVKRFLANLEKQGLFDENTLVLIMPDHPSYSNTPTNKLFKPYRPEFDNLPFIIITRTPVEKPLAQSALVSQLDIAPTVLDLLNIQPPKAFFGHSLFDTSARRSVFDIKEDYAVVTTDDGTRVLKLNSANPQDRALIRLITSFPH